MENTQFSGTGVALVTPFRDDGSIDVEDLRKHIEFQIENGVDVMVPGERVAVIDHRGAKGKASGSSFAVPRIAALAARLLARNPDWRAAELKRAIVGRARPSRFYETLPVRYGWIPDPADDF